MYKKSGALLIFFSLLGIATTGFLSYQFVHLGMAPLCGVGSSCYRVLAQSFFAPFGLFVGWLGLAVYSFFFLFGVVMCIRPLPPRLAGLLDGAAFFTCLLAAILVGTEFFVVKTFYVVSVESALFTFGIWYTTGNLKHAKRGEAMAPRLPKPIVTASAFVIVFITSLVVVWVGVQVHGPDGIVAAIGPNVITRNEMSKAPLVSQAERRLYAAEQTWLDDKIHQVLLQREAAAQSISVESLLEENVNNAFIIIPSELHNYYAAHREEFSGSFGQAQNSITAKLREQKQADLTTNLYGRLEDKYRVRIYLKPPPSPTFEVSTKDANWYGAVGAPVTMVEFGDFQCPFTAQSSGTVNELLQLYGDKLRIAALDFPLTIHPFAFRAAVAARCAGQQGKYWEYRQLLFAAQKDFRPGVFLGLARSLGLDMGRFRACQNSPKVPGEIFENQQEGQRLGIASTPTYFVNGKMISGALPAADFEKAIDAALHDAK